jgi:hypothetical protein
LKEDGRRPRSVAFFETARSPAFPTQFKLSAGVWRLGDNQRFLGEWPRNSSLPSKSLKTPPRSFEIMTGASIAGVIVLSG